MIIEKNERLANDVNQLHILIVDSGYAQLGRDWNCLQTCSPYSRIYLTLAGEGIIRAGSGMMPLRPGYLCLIPAGLAFDYACHDSMNQLYFHVNVLAPDGTDLLDGLGECSSIPVPQEEIEDVLRCYRGQRLADVIGLKAILVRYVDWFITQSGLGDRQMQDSSPFLRKLYTYVRQSLDARTSIHDLADHLMISPSSLTKRFKAETSTSLGKYLDALLFQKAQQLLLSTDLTIGEVADRLGFCDQFYFSRYFKQRQEETPRQYRSRLRVRI